MDFWIWATKSNGYFHRTLNVSPTREKHLYTKRISEELQNTDIHNTLKVSAAKA